MGPELLLLIIALIVVLIWRGPSTLPRLGEAAGKAVTSIRHGLQGRSRDEAGVSSESSDESGTRGKP